MSFEGKNMDEIIAEANAKGMVLVDSENTDNLLSEYRRVTKEADALCEVIDDDSRPFESKYKARELLDGLLRQLEANRTIALVEHKSSLVGVLDAHIAATQLRIGGISWDCEEPHNAQKELEQACAFFFPAAVQNIDERVRGIERESESESVTEITEGEKDALTATEARTQAHTETHTPKSDAERAAEASASAHTLSEECAPRFASLSLSQRGDALKTLNLLGILWAGRGQPYRSLHYLLLANHCYASFQRERETQRETEGDAKSVEEIENAYTHNLFYLAQAYGNLGDATQSSRYCQQTLQRQLDANLVDIRSACEWVRNCCGIADFFFARQLFQSCALALASAERVMRERVISALHVEMEREKAIAHKDEEGTPSTSVQKPNFVSGNLNAAEIEAELHRRWALLDTHVLRAAAEREKERRSARELGMTEEHISSLQGPSQTEKEDNEHINAITRVENKTSEDSKDVQSSPLFCFFLSLPVTLPEHLRVSEINRFEIARAVFLRAATRIEAAKKYYVLDGYVTDHCHLLQEHSKLFHALAEFESDLKRKLAMELRRIDILTPLIRSLNKSSYEVLHKQISYELGEAALVVLDLKLDKFRQKTDGQGMVVNESLLKKSEIAKVLEYTRSGYAMFSHFSFLYAHNDQRTNEHAFPHLETLPLPQLIEIYCKEPDESLITAEEVRPFLNATFLSCRLLSKVVSSPQDTPKQRAQFLVCALRRYQWLVNNAQRLCEKRGLDVTQTFGEELQIAREMVQLLPSKIDRMCFLGEKGLSL